MLKLGLSFWVTQTGNPNKADARIAQNARTDSRSFGQSLSTGPRDQGVEHSRQQSDPHLYSPECRMTTAVCVTLKSELSR
jgi:hypothetical protein